MVDRKCRISDRVLDDAVHRLALMYTEESLKSATAMNGTPEFIASLPGLLADEYCEASEIIRARINRQRLTDGTQPDTFSDTDTSKA